MAILKKSIRSVGIKELKDQASSIIDQVERKRHSITITRNNREVARIVLAVAYAEQSLNRIFANMISSTLSSESPVSTYQIQYLTADRRQHVAFTAEGYVGNLI